MGVRRRLGVAAAVLAVAGSTFAGAPASAATAGSIDWKPCANAPDVDCGSVTVPIDWAHPGKGTIQIALSRRKATDPAHRIGSVLMDPGGPGGPGAGSVRDGWTLSPEITKRFDTVGFDPRGVGDSSPIKCGSNEVSAPYPRMPKNQKEFEQLEAHNRAVGESCAKLSGPLAGFVDTKSVARDMDAIRAALGDQKLTYYGVSYGTLMGQQYAELFPDHIRALVLDSDMDHSIAQSWRFLQTETQTVQAEFGQFAAWCDRTAGCALHGQDVPATLAKLQDRAAAGTLTAPDSHEPITPLDLAGMISSDFYGPDWSSLATEMAALRDGVAPPPQSKVKDDEPVPEAFQPVFCQDWNLPVHNFAELDAYRRGVAALSPDVKLSSLGWQALTGCLGWPQRTTNPQHPLQVHGAPPLLMVNSLYDPATPYAWAQAASRQSGATLLTYDGYGHGAYEKNSDCVIKTTDDYLINGKVPARGTHCAAVEPGAGQPPASAKPAQRSAF